MYVERLLPAARERLVTMADDALLTEAANFLHKGADLVIVCGFAGFMTGVITKTDIIGQMSRCVAGAKLCNNGSCITAMMTRRRNPLALSGQAINCFKMSGSE